LLFGFTHHGVPGNWISSLFNRPRRQNFCCRGVIMVTRTIVFALLWALAAWRNSPFAGLREARAVNGSGLIVGIGWDGVRHAGFLAVPK
jgi:hypothetical protein